MHRIYKIGILHELVTKNPVQHVVTSDIVSRLRCQPISRPLSRIPILSNRRRRIDGAGEWDRILALCRQERYPDRRRAQQNCDRERPAKAAGRSSLFRPKASAPRHHERNGLDFDWAAWLRGVAPESQKQRGTEAEQPIPSRTNEWCAGGV
jgi:hypothetical protein